MPILGITLDRTNPTTYGITDFTFWMPQYKKFMETEDGAMYFNKLYPLANQRIYKSIFGSDWEYAMSLCIAHYISLIAKNAQATSGSTLADVAGSGTYQGIISSASIGSFSKSFDNSMTLLQDDDSAKFWNQTSYGASLMALYKTKAVPSIFVVTSDTSNLPPSLS